MSYDFSLRVPSAKRSRRKRDGSDPIGAARIARACEILRAHESGLTWTEQDGLTTVHSAELGDILVEANRISLAMSMGTAPTVVYRGIHELMRRFRNEDYEAWDLQLRSPRIEYRETFPEFMRQYREHFRCLDSEFERWLRGETPPEWAARKEALRTGAERAAAAFPRSSVDPWLRWKTLDDAGLWREACALIAANDERIARFDLARYLEALELNYCGSRNLAPRRMDGRLYPSELDARWFRGSALADECSLLSALRARGFAAALSTRRQRVTVELERPFERPAAQLDAWHALVRRVARELRAARLLQDEVDSTVSDAAAVAAFYGDDADVLFEAIWPAITQQSLAIQCTRRYGGVGCTERVDVHAGSG